MNTIVFLIISLFVCIILLFLSNKSDATEQQKVRANILEDRVLLRLLRQNTQYMEPKSGISWRS